MRKHCRCVEHNRVDKLQGPEIADVEVSFQQKYNFHIETLSPSPIFTWDHFQVHGQREWCRRWWSPWGHSAPPSGSLSDRFLEINIYLFFSLIVINLKICSREAPMKCLDCTDSVKESLAKATQRQTTTDSAFQKGWFRLQCKCIGGESGVKIRRHLSIGKHEELGHMTTSRISTGPLF